jgi:hypothetical protein
VRRVALNEHHQPKGRVHNFVAGKPMPKPTMLEIVKLPEADACHIHYLGDRRGLLAETWHPSVDAALYHAKWEYGIEPEEWAEPGGAGRA